MSELEESYRRVLRLLPASYRAERGEEMVAAFLESAGGHAQEDLRRPSLPEVASVAALALRVRLGGVGASPRSFAWGETVRLVAVLGLFFHAALTFLYLGGFLRLTGVIGTTQVEYMQVYGTPASPERLWGVVQVLAGGLWVGAAGALAANRVRPAKVLAVLALAFETSQLALTLADPFWWEALTARAPLFLMAVVPVVALLAGFHRDAPPVRWFRPRVAWPLIGAGVILPTALGAVAMGLDVHPWAWPWVDMPGVACASLLIGGVAYFGARRSLPAARTPSWPLALAILTVPVLCARLPILRLDAPDPITQTMTLISAAQCAAVLLSGLALLIVGVRSLPRPPAARNSTFSGRNA